MVLMPLLGTKTGQDGSNNGSINTITATTIPPTHAVSAASTVANVFFIRMGSQYDASKLLSLSWHGNKVGRHWNIQKNQNMKDFLSNDTIELEC